MLDTAHYHIKRSAKTAGLDHKKVQELLESDKDHKFEVELRNGKKYSSFRVQHNNKLGPYKGGIRFHEEVNFDEVKALATLMSFKTAAVGLKVNPRELSRHELEELSRKYVQYLHCHIGPEKDVPAPDVNTNSEIIDWMTDEFEKLTGDQSKAAFTGKSLTNGGSLGREAATGRGGVITLREVLKELGQEKSELTYAVQGYGNVGAFFATVAADEQPQWKLLAATDSKSGIFSPNGLDATFLSDHKKSGKPFSEIKADDTESISNDDLVGLNVDILVLAALGDAVNDINVPQIKAKYIVELANGPITVDAHEYLLKSDKVIIPDIIANAGGVIVSYLEWFQNQNNEKWTEEEVNSKLNEYLVKAVKELNAVSKKYDTDLTEAAYILAIDRLSTD
jgi:glutamate dehydrogenase